MYFLHLKYIITFLKIRGPISENTFFFVGGRLPPVWINNKPTVQVNLLVLCTVRLKRGELVIIHKYCNTNNTLNYIYLYSIKHNTQVYKNIFRMLCAFCYEEHPFDLRCAPRDQALVDRILRVDLTTTIRTGYT